MLRASALPSGGSGKVYLRIWSPFVRTASGRAVRSCARRRPGDDSDAVVLAYSRRGGEMRIGGTVASTRNVPPLALHPLSDSQRSS